MSDTSEIVSKRYLIYYTCPAFRSQFRDTLEEVNEVIEAWKSKYNKDTVSITTKYNEFDTTYEVRFNVSNKIFDDLSKVHGNSLGGSPEELNKSLQHTLLDSVKVIECVNQSSTKKYSCSG